MRKDMQKEIHKYQGFIYYFDTESKTLWKIKFQQDPTLNKNQKLFI